MQISKELVLERLREVLKEMRTWPLFARSADLPPPYERVAASIGNRLLASESFVDYQLELQNRQSALLLERVLAVAGRNRLFEVSGAPATLSLSEKKRFDAEIAEAWVRYRTGEEGADVSIGCVRHTLIMLSHERAFGFALPEHASFERMGAACRAGYVPAVITKAAKRVYPERHVPELEVERWVAF
jgi:hypothetical protein